MSDARGTARTAAVLPRVLLVVAVALGLCAMHVLAAAVSPQHATIHSGVSTTAVGHAPSGAAATPTTDAVAGAHDSARFTAHAADHDHAVSDCVLFLSAGIALLVLLIGWAAARALRPSYRLTDPWPTTALVTTPWRGPPWRWPRFSLCVIRV